MSEYVYDASVVIPSYNGEKKLPRLLDSLVKQEGASWEAIVVLDGSTDNSKAVVEKYSQECPTIRFIDLGENQGRPSALKAGFAAAQGRVYIRCDDDLDLPSTFIKNHVAHHQGEPVGVIGMCPDELEDTKFAQAFGTVADQRIRSSSYALAPENRWRMWSANVSVTAETYERVGPYDQDYREYGWEDIDWGYRLHQLGIPVIIPRDIEAIHYGPATSIQVRADKAYASGKSRALFLTKHPEMTHFFTAQNDDKSLWNKAVGLTCRLMTQEKNVNLIGKVADSLVNALPVPVGRKIAYLVVEAAGQAGDQQGR